jgi:hypothetical protein
MFAVAPFCVLPFAVAAVAAPPPPPPVVIVDGHDGGKNTHKKRKEPRYDEDSKRREARRKEVISIYEELVEGRPRVVAEIVAPFVETPVAAYDIPAVEQIDFDALLADVERLQALYREMQEKDDEEVLLLLL